MLKLLAAIILLMNPLTGLFMKGQLGQKDASLNEAPLFNAVDGYRLPLAGDIFLAAKLPIWPMRNWSVPEPQILAGTALVYDTYHDEILYQKNNIFEPRSIASLTKLMTALVTMEHAKLNDVFKISEQAVQALGEQGGLKTNEELSVKSLLYALLVESSNDAAQALAENIDLASKLPAGSAENFIGLMNQKAKNLGLQNSIFVDPSGLESENQSSAWELVKTMQETLEYPILQEIMQTPAIDLSSVDGKIRHHLINTNKLLDKIPDVVAGKTGYTEEAGGCMILAAKAPDGKSLIIAVVMDSQNRMADIETLINWTKEAYMW